MLSTWSKQLEHRNPLAKGDGCGAQIILD